MTEVMTTPSGVPADFRACHALVVEPRLGQRRLLHSILEDLGCASIAHTSKPREAWSALHLGGVGVLFLDWSGEIDAPTFVRTLRAGDSPHRFLPVVVMSYYGSTEDIATIRDSGATEFLLKPLSPETVANRLHSAILAPRLYVQADDYFGPDRRRHRGDWRGAERRQHHCHQADRRQSAGSDWHGPERRQCPSGFLPLERRNAPRV